MTRNIQSNPTISLINHWRAGPHYSFGIAGCRSSGLAHHAINIQKEPAMQAIP